MNETLAYKAKTLDEFLCQLLDMGAVKIDTAKGFRLKLHESNPDAPLSPLYFNLRIAENKGLLTYAEVSGIAQFFYDFIESRKIQFDGICGIPRAGEPFAKALQEIIYNKKKITVPLLTLQKDETTDGRHIGKLLKAQELPRGSAVLILDDLITQAGSKIEAIESLRHEGFIVDDCLVFLDRQQGGGAHMSEHAVNLNSITSIASALEVYLDSNRITKAQYDIVHTYLKAA